MDREREELSQEIIIRTLRLEDTSRLVRMDEEISGRSRRTWYERKIDRALKDTDIRISLGAESDGVLVGALLGSVFYGEFGQVEPVAVLDTMLVDQAFQGRGIAKAMLDQLLKNLRALRISRLRTEVGWNEVELITFFERNGFTPIPRLVLELDVSAADGEI
jgi:GNAT superfamily N-acetyltransferase